MQLTPAQAGAAYICNACNYNIGGGTVTYPGLTLSNGGTIYNGTFSSAGNMALQEGSVGAVLAGAGATTKTTAGTVTLSGANTYAGATTVSAGTLALTGSGTLGSTAAELTVNGGTLSLGSTNQTTGAMVLSNGGSITSSTGSLSSASFGVKSGSVSAILAGSGELTKNSAGVVTLSGANSYTGGTTVVAGTLSLTGSGTLGASSGGLTVNGGTLDLGGTSQTTGAMVLSGGGSITGPGTLTSSSYTVKSGTIGASLAGAGALTKTTSGTVTLSAANSYTGGTTVNAGKLALIDQGTLGTGGVTVNGGTLDIGSTNQTTGDITLTGGTITGSGSLTSSAYDVQAGSVEAALAGSGAVTKTGKGLVTLSAANSYTGGTTVTEGTLGLTGSGTLGASSGGLTVNGGTLDLGGTSQTTGAMVLSGGGSITGPGTLTSSSYTVKSGTIGASLAGAGALTKTTSGTVTLSAANSYTGGTTVNAGKLALIDQGTLGTGGVTVNGGTLDIGSTNQTTGDITLTGGTITGSGSLTSSAYDVQAGKIATDLTGDGALTKTGRGTAVITGNAGYTGGTTVSGGTLQIGDGGATGNISGNVVNHATLAFDLGGDTTSTAIISGSGDVTKSGAGNLTFTGQGSYTGDTRVNEGTLALSGDASIAQSSGVYVADGAIFDISGTNDGASITTLGDGAVGEGGNVMLGAQTLTVTNASTTFSGVISDAGAGGALVLSGGSLTLGGENDYSGGTTIANGAILYLGQGATLGSGSVTLSGDGELVFAEPAASAPSALLPQSTQVVTPPVTATPYKVDGRAKITNFTSSNDPQQFVGVAGSPDPDVLVLKGTSNFDGTLEIGDATADTALLVRAGSSGAIDPGMDINVTEYSKFDINGYDATIESLTGGGTVVNKGDVDATLTIDGGAKKSQFSGALIDGGGDGNLAVTLAAGTTLALSGTGLSKYTGITTVEDGSTLLGGADDAFSRKSEVVVEDGGALDVGGHDQFIRGLSGDGTVTNTGSAAAVLAITGAPFNDADHPLEWSFDGTITDTPGSELGLDIRSGTALTLTGPDNDYHGDTTIGHGVHPNLLIGGNENAFSANSGVEVAYLSTLDVGGFNQEIASLSDGKSCTDVTDNECGDVENNAGTVTNGGQSDAVLTISGGDDTTFSGAMTDGTTHSLGLTLQGSSTLALAGSTLNTYTGKTVIGDGTDASALVGADENSFSAGSAIEVSKGSVLDLGGHDQEILSLSDGLGGSGGTVTNNGAADATLTMSGGGSSTFSGSVIDGDHTLSLDLIDDTTLTLTGTSTFSGTTYVESGSHLNYGATATVTVDGLTTNVGQFNVSTGGIAHLNGGLDNSGTVNNYGTIYDDLDNTGTVNNYGSYFAALATNEAGATINTTGTWTGNLLNYGTITAAGHIYGDAADSGSIVNGSLPLAGPAAGGAPLAALFQLTGNTDSNGSTFDNAGTFDLADYSFTGLGEVSNEANGLIVMNAASQTLGTTQLTNAGVLSTLDGDVVSNVATIDGDYVGDDGAFLLAVDTVNTTDVRGNVVEITGNASGRTTLELSRIGAARLFAKPILLVDVGGSASGTPFVLDSSSVDSGMVAYDLMEVAPGQYALVSHLSNDANTAVSGLGASLLAGSNVLATTMLDTTGELPHGASSTEKSHVGFDVWVHGSLARAEENLSGQVKLGRTVTNSALATSAQSANLQVGSDIEFSNISDLPVAVHLGITAGGNHVNADQTEGISSSADVNIPFIGLYGTLEASNLYLAGQLQWQNWSGNMDSGMPLDGNDVTGDGYAASIAAAYHLALGHDFSLEPSLGYSYVRASLSSLDFGMGDAGDGHLDLGTVESKLGRAALRLSYDAPDSTIRPYVSAAYTHDFGGAADSALDVLLVGSPDLTMPVSATTSKDFVTVGGGAELDITDIGVSGNLGFAASFGDGFDGASANAGLSYRF